jgi:DNA polymerase I-like protein with 3'-5' exonuclease and polymerase domains
MKKADPTPAPAASSSKKPNRDFTTADYELIQDETLLDEWIAEATRAGTVAFDCETDGLDSNNAGLVGVSLALLEGPWGDVNSSRRRAAYLPLMHRTPGAAVQGALDLLGDGGDKDAGKLLEGQIPFKTAIEKLKPLLEDPAVLKVGQNIKYDMAVFRRHGVEIGRRGRRRHAAPVAVLKPRLAAENMTTVYETLERPLVPVLARMEQRGIAVDRQILSRLSGDFAQRRRRSRRDPRARRRAASTSARPSSSATSCSARWACRAAPRPRPASGRPAPMCWKTSRRGPRTAAQDRSTGASSPS